MNGAVVSLQNVDRDARELRIKIHLPAIDTRSKLTVDDHLSLRLCLGQERRDRALDVAAELGRGPHEFDGPVHGERVVARLVGRIYVLLVLVRSRRRLSVYPLVQQLLVDEPLDHETVRRGIAELVLAVQDLRPRAVGPYGVRYVDRRYVYARDTWKVKAFI